MKKVFIKMIALCFLCCFCLTSCFITNPPTPEPDDSTGDSGNTLPDDENTTPDDSEEVTRPNKPDEDPSDDPVDNPGDDPKPEDDQPLKILFLGNSLMFFNDMPGLFRDMATAAGKQVYVDSVTRGSATISDFAREYTDVGAQAYQKIQNERWDYIIIEPSRRITPYENTTYEAELASAHLLQQMAAKAGAKILLYCVWGNNDGTLTQYDATDPANMIKGQVHYDYTRKMHVEFLKKVNTEFAEALGGVGVIDAGYAFENSMALYPNINLYDPDRRHPSLEGSYLAAACVYATIYKQSPENIGFTGGTPLYFEMQKTARITVIDKTIPDLTDIPEVIEQVDDPNTYDILFIGSDLIDSYDITTPLTSMVELGQNTALKIDYVTNTTGVFSKLAQDTTDFGMRDELARVKYDAVILQVSRRCTPSAADVEASELAALKVIYPIIAENCDNIYLYTLNGSSNAAIFTTASDPVNYSKTGSNENATAAQMNVYYTDITNAWAEEVGCGVILQGNAWTEFSPSTDAAKGYLRACAIYNSIFEAEVPDGVNTNGIDATVADRIEAVAKKHCLPEEEDTPVVVPEYDTYDVLVIGSKLIDNNNADVTTALSSMVTLGQGKELHIQFISNDVGVLNKLAKADTSDNFYSEYKAAMTERKWDAIVIQISRRITPTGTDVAASELEALKSIYGTLSDNCHNIYLITLIGSDNATVFTTEGGKIEYSKTDYKESYSAAQMSEFYTELANEWAEELGCKVIDQGQARIKIKTNSDAEKGYLRACCYYNALFGEKIPDGASTNNLSADRAQAIAKMVEKVIFNIPPTDLTALNEAIALADQKDENSFTPNSWVAFAQALANAKALNSDSEQADVDAAIVALNEAMTSLVARADFTAMNTAVEAANSKVQINYTDATWAKLVEALAGVESINANSSQEEVDAVTNALNDAIDHLVIKADLTALNEAITLAESKNADSYTTATWSVLADALANAKTLDENSPVDEVGNATVALNEAIAGLVLKADLTALNEAIASASELNADEYTDATWQALQDALNGASGLTTESVQADVDAAAKSIKDAIDALAIIPTLPEYDTYDVLFIGSDLINDEYIAPSLSSMISLGQGKELYLKYVNDGIGVINRLATHDEISSGNDVYLLLREALAERRWDAIIIQFSRRCTPGSSVVESEFNALKSIYPILTANTDNIYLFTLNGSENPSVFTTGDAIAYTKTGETYTATKDEMSAFYQSTVEDWCEKLGCKSILYGSAYIDMAPSTDKAKGFMRALCIYYSVFGEEMPDGTNVQGTSSSGVKKIKSAAAKYCLNA